MDRKISDPNPVFRVLLIEDDHNTAELLGDALSIPEIEFHYASDAASGFEEASALNPDLILLDPELPGTDGMDLLDRLLSHNPNHEIFVFSGLHSHEKAVEAIRRGAVDYIPRPLAVDDLAAKIREKARLASQNIEIPVSPENARAFREREGIIGRSPELLSVLGKIERIGPHFRTALVCGDTGTGKDLIARALHRNSGASGPFVVCNCAAIVESLFESELFGYQKGAFTGASEDRAGLFEHANGGTLFLDEVGELPPTTQAKLLRVLQTREVQRTGASHTRKVDVRVVAATNRDLRRMVHEQTFREDLYFRLALIQLDMPRLANRISDLPLLENHFLNRFSDLYQTPRQRLDRRVQTILRKHSWPGNIRELENVIAYCCMISRNEVIEATDLPEYLRTMRKAESFSRDNSVSLREMRAGYVARVLERTGGNRVRAAQILRIGRGTLLRYLKDATHAPSNANSTASN